MNRSNHCTNDRILIVDDNPAIHEDYRKILEAQPVDGDLDELSALVLGEDQEPSNVPQFKLHSAYQGQEALEMVMQAIADGQPFAMAFVDMRMPPGWDGLQTIEHLWKVDSNLQVVICTAFSDYSWSEIIDRVEHRDRLLILKKPFDNVEVCQLAISLTHKWELERQAENRMDSIVETAADGIITLDATSAIESCNRAACELFGYSEEELLSTPFCSLLKDPPATSWEECADYFLVKENGKHSPAREVEGLQKSGGSVPLLLSVSTYDTHDGKRFTLIARDLSEYKQLQETLSRAQKLESVGQLAAGVAHEINTPMQFIYQNMEFLQTCADKIARVFEAFERNLDVTRPNRPWEDRWQEVNEVLKGQQFDMVRSELPQAIEESLEGVQRVVSIVRAMKEFAHPGHGEKTPVDINHAVESTITITRNHWKDVANVETQFDSHLPRVTCVQHDINQVLVNLIVNAVDAVEECRSKAAGKGTITVRTRSDSEYAVIEVEDSGCGIPEELHHRIFDPFFTTKEVGHGTGQGLSIAFNAVVQHHGGTIDVESSPGAGTKFTVRLPIGDDDPIVCQEDEKVLCV